MKSEYGNDLITIKDIAEAIAYRKTSAAINRTLRQVRHWTQNDLLQPYGEKQTGKGIPRFYEDWPAVLIAALYLELSRYGATVEILKPVAKALYEDMENGMTQLNLSLTNESMVYAQIAWKGDQYEEEETKVGIRLFNDDPDFFGGDEGMSKRPPSWIIINITNIVERIFPLPWMEPLPSAPSKSG